MGLAVQARDGVLVTVAAGRRRDGRGRAHALGLVVPALLAQFGRAEFDVDIGADGGAQVRRLRVGGGLRRDTASWAVRTGMSAEARWPAAPMAAAQIN